jgi:hypothetical protein
MENVKRTSYGGTIQWTVQERYTSSVRFIHKNMTSKETALQLGSSLFVMSGKIKVLQYSYSTKELINYVELEMGENIDNFKSGSYYVVEALEESHYLVIEEVF